MRARVHPRVAVQHPEIAAADALHAFENSMLSRARATRPIQWVGIGADSSGRLLEYIAVEDEPDGWLIFHCMRATNKVLNEIGSGR